MDIEESRRRLDAAERASDKARRRSQRWGLVVIIALAVVAASLIITSLGR